MTAHAPDVALVRDRLDASLAGERSRVAGFHASVFAWVKERVARAGRAPTIVGLSAPQGAGKSTMAENLVALAGAHGLAAVTISIDDFYLTRDQQQRLAAAHPDHPYLAHRGYPGTHDLALGERTLDALRATTAGEVLLPRYDKSQHGGHGDRAPTSAWPRVERPLALVIVEGWMVGFQPPEPDLDDDPPTDPWLGDIDTRLRGYAAWWRHLDAMVHLHAADPDDFIAWRVEAEERRKAQGGAGLSTAAIEAYARTFAPAYRRYVPWLVRHPLAVATLAITIGRDRLPLATDAPA